MNRKRRLIAALGVAAGGAFLMHNNSGGGTIHTAAPIKSLSGPEASNRIHRLYDTELVSTLQKNRGTAHARMKGYIPNIELFTDANKRVLFYDDMVKGKVVMINFIFTLCGGICPLTTVNLIEVQKGLGERLREEIHMYSVTLDPEIDTPETLTRYATSLGVKPGWSFLTGNFNDIELLRYRLGIYDPDPIIDADKTQHGGLVIYGNEATGKWSAIPGLLKPSEIVRAVLRVV